MKESIRESMIYGYMIEPINEGLFDNNIKLLDEQVEVINEMHFSKKDLQDPKTIDKILKRKEFFENCIHFITTLEIILIVLISIVLGVVVPVIGGVIAFPILMMAFASTLETLMSLPNKWYIKNSEKFEKQVRELLDKTKKKLDKDPKNKDKYNKIISNCQKIIDIIEKKKAEAKKAYDDAVHQDELNYYKQVPEWLEHPYMFGHTGNGGYFSEWLYCAKILKVSEKDIIKTIENNKNDKNCFMELTISGEYTDYKGRKREVINEDEVEGWITLHNHDYEKAVEELGDHAWLIQSDDDYGIWYTETNKFIETDAGTPYKFITLSSFAEKGKKNLPENIDDILIDADKELGYYRLSKCPAQVKKKKFPV